MTAAASSTGLRRSMGRGPWLRTMAASHQPPGLAPLRVDTLNPHRDDRGGPRRKHSDGELSSAATVSVQVGGASAPQGIAAGTRPMGRSDANVAGKPG